jgi:spermidine/putrescine transport system ATP-binding protein
MAALIASTAPQPATSSSADIDLELRHVSKRFGNVEAVADVSFSIRKGEFFSLLGPSGCGKTTTLRMLAGFEFPDRGEIFIGGRHMGRTPAHARQTNLVFQQLALFPHMNVFDNIAFGLRMKRIPREEIAQRVAETLHLVDLDGYAERRIRQLSGGQQQRVAIARAVVNRPQVLLLDEPLGALDLKLRLQMQGELKRIQHSLGTTFVYVTHDQSEAMSMSDRIGIMHQGRLVQIGTPDEIYEHPNSRFVAGFIGDTNLLDGRCESGHPAAGGEAPFFIQIAGYRVLACGERRPGCNLSLSLRPERVRLGATLAGMDNRFPGIVRDVVQTGGVVKYQVELPDGLSISAQTQKDDAFVPHAIGDRLEVGWNASSAVPLYD